MTLKLDELLRGVEGSRTGFVRLDHMSDQDLNLIQQEFTRMREKYAPLIDDDLASSKANYVHSRSAAKSGASAPPT